MRFPFARQLPGQRAPAEHDLPDARAQHLTAQRWRKFLSYYRPHLGLLCADLACAVLIAATALALPLCANHVLARLSGAPDPQALFNELVMLGVGMLSLLAVQAACTLFVDYQGHVMGAKMEGALRRELFAHYQSLSFGFHDRHRTGELMSRLTNDLFTLSELYHHGPEDAAIALLKFVGAMLVLLHLDLPLTFAIAATLPFAAAYALYFNARMGAALTASKQRIAAINERALDALAGIRVVKTFGNEAVEAQRFDDANTRFLATRRHGYKAEALFSIGLQTYAQLITLFVIVVGAIRISGASLSTADLLTYLLCVAILIDPIARAANFARLWQEGMTGFHRFMDVLETPPEIVDRPDAATLTDVQGRITFRGVSFRYPGSERLALRDLSLDIGERGVQLSGGQRQRLTIARAFLKDPPILVFDEATSALDGDSERAVQRALADIAKGRTMLVIAHRLSTIRHADRIVVLTEDGIAEQGTHEQLLRAGGRYAALQALTAHAALL